MGVTGMTIKVLGMGAGNDLGATSSLDAAAYGEPPFEPTLFSNFLVLCCTPVVQVCLINLVLGLVAFAVRSMQWVVFGRLRAAEWQARHLAPPKRRLSPPQRPALPSLPLTPSPCRPSPRAEAVGPADQLHDGPARHRRRRRRARPRRAPPLVMLHRRRRHHQYLLGAVPQHGQSDPSAGSAPARLLRLLRAGLAALGSSVLPGRGRPTGCPANASSA